MDKQAEVGTALKPEPKLDSSTHCLSCGARLHFSTVTDWVNNMTRERATCPECGAECSHTLHRLQ